MTTPHSPSPIPVPASARRVLLFGGSFDPPHRAHLELPPKAREALGLDWLVYVPAARSPHKQHSPGASGDDRLRMLELGLSGIDRASVWDCEIRRADTGDGPSYTIDTIRLALRQRPDLQLRLLIGADQARSFHLWREPAAITRLAPPAVMGRADNDPHTADTDAALINDIARYWPGDASRRWAASILRLPAVNASATRVRELLAAWNGSARPAPELAAMVPGPILGFIAERGLYGVRR